MFVQLLKIPYSYGDIEYRTVFDSDNHSYCLIHLEIIDGKIWVQRDDTEDGVTYDLEAAGIPKDKIVLDFHAPYVRPHTGYVIT
ncbi:MAG: element excision factor XisI family protein [Nostocales cyanobacterium 94392]|nr:element excision factor XisI family protein [Nostocales cyanobacterium 94392]